MSPPILIGDKIRKLKVAIMVRNCECCSRLRQILETPMLESREGTPVRVAEPPCEVVFVASLNVGFCCPILLLREEGKGKERFQIKRKRKKDLFHQESRARIENEPCLCWHSKFSERGRSCHSWCLKHFEMKEEGEFQKWVWNFKVEGDWSFCWVMRKEEEECLGIIIIIYLFILKSELISQMLQYSCSLKQINILNPKHLS